MDNYFKEIITILLSVATIAGLTIWTIKEIIKKFLQADTERQKSRLQLEHQKFTKLQNEQFDTIKLIYSNLICTDELLREAFEMLKGGQEFDKKSMDRTFVALVKIIFDADRHFKQNSIFLSENLCIKVAKSIDALFFCLTKSAYAMVVKSENVFDANGKLLGIQERNVKDLSEADKTDFEETIKKVDTVRQNELKDSLVALKTEFRILFGVT